MTVNRKADYFVIADSCHLWSVQKERERKYFRSLSLSDIIKPTFPDSKFRIGVCYKILSK